MNSDHTSSWVLSRHEIPPPRYPDFRAYLFGPFRAFRGSCPLESCAKRREKPLMLLKIFLLNQDRPLAMDELVEFCFGDVDPERAAGNFHVTMHSLRRMLEPDLGPRSPSTFVRRTGSCFYRFETGTVWWTDIAEVERLFRQARCHDRRGDRDRACFYYSRVAAYAVRQFLEGDDPDEPWLRPHRRRFESIYTEALTQLIRLHRASDHPDQALEYSRQLFHLAPGNKLAATTMTSPHR